MDSIESLQKDIQHHLQMLLQQYAARDDLLTLQHFVLPVEQDPVLQSISNDVMQLLIAWSRSGGELQLTIATRDHETTSLVLHPEAASATERTTLVAETAEAENTRGKQPEADEEAEAATETEADEVSAAATLPPPEPSPPATAADIDRLLSSFGSSTHHQTENRMLVAGEHLLTALEERDGLSGASLGAFLNLHCTRLSTLKAAPSEMLKLWLSWLTAELRTLQEIAPELNLDASFNLVTAFSKSRQPGFIHGLARNHHPRSSSWKEDAARYHKQLIERYVTPSMPSAQSQADRALNALRPVCTDGDPEALRRQVRATLRAGVPSNDIRLVQLVAPHLEHLDGSDLESLRAAVRTHRRPATAENCTEKTSIPAKVRSWTSGRRALILGGIPRAERIPEIREQLGFETLSWEELSHSCIERAIHQIHSDQVHVVIAIQNLINHTVEYRIKPACKNAGVPYVLVGGYGVTAIAHALGRLISPGLNAG